jgi:hypothetical protein
MHKNIPVLSGVSISWYFPRLFLAEEAFQGRRLKIEFRKIVQSNAFCGVRVNKKYSGASVSQIY